MRFQTAGNDRKSVLASELAERFAENFEENFLKKHTEFLWTLKVSVS